MTDFKPQGWRCITPRIITKDVSGLVEFVKTVFDASGELREGGEPTEITIGDCRIMISDGGGVREMMPAFLYVYVKNTDDAYTRAIEAGAEPIEPPTHMPYGDRRATVHDRWGNLWQIATYHKR